MKKSGKGEGSSLVHVLVSERGFSSVGEFLDAHPAKPYFAVAKELGNSVTAADIRRAQYSVASISGRLRDAARDALVRELAGNIKRGWGRGRNSVFNAAAAFAFWSTGFKHYANAPEKLPLLSAVWKTLESVPPPVGWRPTGNDDELIQKAFTTGWPSK